MKRNKPNWSKVTGSSEPRAEGKGRPTGLPDPALYCALHDTEWDPGDACHDCLKAVAKAVIDWASAPGDHGGNPYCKPFVRLARKAMRDE